MNVKSVFFLVHKLGLIAFIVANNVQLSFLYWESSIPEKTDEIMKVFIEF